MNAWFLAHLEWVFFAMAAVILILFLLILVLWHRLAVQKKRYDFFMGTGRRPTFNLETKIEEYFKTSQRIASDYAKILDMVTDMDQTMHASVQKVGLIRYNPFDEMGGNLCFALALLDGKDNGVVINGIHSRTGSFTYAKPIEMGVSTYMLSEEEMQAVKMAQEQAYKPEHEKVIKVKFKPTFHKRDKDAVMEDQISLEEAEQKPTPVTNVTAEEKEAIASEELRARRISSADVANPALWEKMAEASDQISQKEGEIFSDTVEDEENE